MSLKLAVVILHYGDPALTGRLYEQLRAGMSENYNNLYVLDNHAPEPYPDSWQRLPENRFWAGALDYCIAEFERTGFTHLWFLNNDILFLSDPPLIERVNQRLAYLEHRLTKVGIYSPCFTTNPYHPQMVKGEGNGFRLVRYIDGIAPVINLKCCRDVGGLDCKDNPIGYGVDVWLSFRAYVRGWAVVVDQAIVAKHFYHSTARQVDNFLERAAFMATDYLRARLGDKFKTLLGNLAKEYQYVE